VHDFLNPLEVGTFNLTGKEGLPFWTIIHYFERTISNHMKLTTIQRICELSANGVPDSHFYLAKKSVDIYQEEPLNDGLFKDYIVLATKSNSPERFWDSILNLKRPVVFFDNGNKRIPLYDFTYEEALRISYFREQSPFNVNLDGGLGSLADLFYAREREERNRIQFENDYIGQASNNLENIVRSSQTIQNPDVPPGVRYYAEQQMYALLNAQEKLNQKVGINQVRIDIQG
jgi:hypothetical protein